jgi:hypothetical protein
MDRFYGYNRDDYYFKTSCREAFGSDFDSYHKPTSLREKVSAILWVASIVMILASIGSFL